MLEHRDVLTPALPPLISPARGNGQKEHQAGSDAYGPQSPERRLLLACIRQGHDPADVQRALTPPLDWERVLDEVTHHGVASLVYSPLKAATDGAMVPAAVMERFASLYYQQAALNGRLFTELRSILAACARAGIRVLMLKGAAMAERVYGNVALCPMKDLDLLVRKEDLEATDNVLRALGYVPDESYQSAAWFRDHSHQLAPYSGPDGRALVELHHHILPPSAPVHIPIEDLWRRARPAHAGNQALVLCPEDLLLHLCLHTSLKHRFGEGLRSMCDISHTIRSYGDDIDWKQVRDRADQWRVRKHVYLALRLARDLGGAAVSEAFLDALLPERDDSQVVLWARTQILGDGHPIPHPPEPLAQLCGAKRLREKAALLLENAVPSAKALAQRYQVSPDSHRIYLYYPIRWWNLLRRHGRSTWRLLLRDGAVVAEREKQKAALREWLDSSL